MRYFIATIATALTLCAQTARADHDVTSLAFAYHESLHAVIDAARCSPRSSSYFKASLTRLDRSADQFAEALATDPYCQRTQFLFKEMRYMHQRVERLVHHGCRSYDYCTPQWHQADEFFHALEAEFAGCCNRGCVDSPLIQPRVMSEPFVQPPVLQAPLQQAPVMYEPRPSVRIPRMGEYSVRNSAPAVGSAVPRYESHRIPSTHRQHPSMAPVNNRPQSNSQVASEMIFRLISGLAR